MVEIWESMGAEDVVGIVLAVGSLGTAAFGIVEGFKWTPLGLKGFKHVTMAMREFDLVLSHAYGKDFNHLLSGYYRRDREQLGRILRQGIRIGLDEKNAELMAKKLDLPSQQLVDAVDVVGRPDEEEITGEMSLSSEIKKKGSDWKALQTLGRYEMVADARIDSSLARAQHSYEQTMRMWAMGVSVLIGTGMGTYFAFALDTPYEDAWKYVIGGLAAGIAGVPLAPIAKDVASAVRSAAKALGRRGRSA